MPRYALRPVDRSDLVNNEAGAHNVADYLDVVGLIRGDRLVRASGPEDDDYVVLKQVEDTGRWDETRSYVKQAVDSVYAR